MTDETTFRLDHYLKAIGVAATGGQAKILIQSGQVAVNGQIETRRRKQLRVGDTVDALGERFIAATIESTIDGYAEEEIDGES